MRQKQTKPYLLIFVTLLLLMSLPQQSSQKLRGSATAILAPTWSLISFGKTWIASLFSMGGSINSEKLERDLQHLQLENTLLKTELNSLKKVEPNTPSFQATQAKVIFRSLSSWHHSLWLNIGSEKNEELGFTCIAKNSPVTVGESIIGIIDYVGKKQSRVKLITDPGLSPSVRVYRGSGQKKYLLDQLNLIENTLATSFLKDETTEMQFKNELAHFKQVLMKEELPSLFLAKGELKGCSRSAWRSQIPKLRGTGFNYDFADKEGPARDLLTGIPENIPLPQKATYDAPPLISQGDLLIATGMDGLFPEGLHIARVTHVYPLKEGDFYYELEAEPTVTNLDELSIVFVLPPLGFNQLDLPTPFGR